jgi:predicted MFS family arabinose efflux permease
MLLFAPPAGVVADRVDRKRLLVVTRFLIGVAATALAVLLHAGVESRGLLAGFGFVLGTLFAFLAPAQQAITANAVPASDLSSAISLLAAGNNLNRILGPAIGALILGAAGPGWAFTAYAAVNIVTVVLLVPIQISRRQEPSEHLGAWEQWKEGLRYARERSPALGVLLSMSVLSVFGIAYVALYPVFTTEVFGRPKNDFTMLVIASGVGALVGALAVGLRKAGPTLRGALIWTFAFGVAALGFTFARSWELALVLNCFVGFCYFSITTSLNTVLQELAEDEKRGRLSGLFTLTWAGLIPIGGIWMGTVADLGGAPLTLQIGASVCLVYAVIALPRYATVPPR